MLLLYGLIMLLSAARVLELSVATNVGSWLADQRTAELETLHHPLNKQVGKAAVWFAGNHPRNAEKVLDLCARSNGYSYLGAGVEFSAYLRLADNMAVKVHRTSAGKADEELQALVREKNSAHQLLASYLGNTVLPQTVFVAEHVLGGGFQTLQIEQPYIRLANTLSPFSVNAPTVDITKLEKMVASRPGSDVAMHELIDQSLKFYDDKVQLPDTNGTNNVVVRQDGSLALLDTTPIGNEHPGVQDLILSQVRSLEFGLQELGV